MKRKRLPAISTVRKKCDKLLTPIIKLLYPTCLLCGEPTQVAHHHIHKSKSTRLRYEIDNLINLCNRCHIRLHSNESYWASVVVQKRGLEWFAELDKKNQEIVKADVHFYIYNHERLLGIYQQLEKVDTEGVY